VLVGGVAADHDVQLAAVVGAGDSIKKAGNC
jgi:hypothetical protein